MPALRFAPLLLVLSLLTPNAAMTAAPRYYDVAYRAPGWFTVRGSASYGSREGAGRFGGGLGLETLF